MHTVPWSQHHIYGGAAPKLTAGTALAWLVVNPHAAAVQLDQAFGDHQSQPCAGYTHHGRIIGTKILGEHALLIFRRDSYASVRHRTHDELPLRPTIPASIELRVETPEHLPEVMADPTQLNQVLLNLAINARDALDGKGHITFSAAAVAASGVCQSCHESFHRQFVQISEASTAAALKVI